MTNSHKELDLSCNREWKWKRSNVLRFLSRFNVLVFLCLVNEEPHTLHVLTHRISAVFWKHMNKNHLPNHNNKGDKTGAECFLPARISHYTWCDPSTFPTLRRTCLCDYWDGQRIISRICTKKIDYNAILKDACHTIHVHSDASEVHFKDICSISLWRRTRQGHMKHFTLKTPYAASHHRTRGIKWLALSHAM